MIRDCACIVGLAMIAAGFWMLSPAVALIVIGAIMCAGAIYGTVRQ